MFIVLGGFIIAALVAGTCFLAQYKQNVFTYQGMGPEEEAVQLEGEVLSDMLFCYGFALGIIIFVLALLS